MEEKNETAQAHGAGKADPEAFAAIVRGNQRWLRGYFRARLSDWTAADDLAQDVFITAFRQIRSFRGDSSIASWLRAIAHNHLRNHFRKHREQAIGGSEELQAILEQSCDSWQGDTPTNKTLEALATCKERMPKAATALLNMRYTQGKSVREISQETGKGYSALTMKFHRLRELLAECITMELEKSGAGGTGHVGLEMEKPRGESA
ncbi:MAG: RNA polymerase sigma factor [Opitutales bacterium]